MKLDISVGKTFVVDGWVLWRQKQILSIFNNSWKGGLDSSSSIVWMVKVGIVVIHAHDYN